jgi:hypothetical protein
MYWELFRGLLHVPYRGGGPAHEINLALSDPRITQRIADLGDTPLPLSTSAFASLIAEETTKWGKVILAANIKAE